MPAGRTPRKGNAALLLVIVVAVGAGLVAASPDTAQDVLPAQVLPILPAFESVETGASCEDIEQGTELANDWIPEGVFGGEELSPEQVKTQLCTAKCGSKADTAGTYCSDDTLTCVCRASGSGSSGA